MVVKDKDKEKERFALKPGAFGKGTGDGAAFSFERFEELQQLLRLTVVERSMLLLTGQAGVGKTSAVRYFTDELPTNKYQVVYLGQEHEGDNLARRLALSLGLQAKRFRSHTWLTVNQYLSDNLIEQGKEIVLVVDEAHLLSDLSLEDLRLLTNADFDRTSPLSVIMMGQLGLRSRLKSNGFEALNQRLRYRYALEGLTEEETADYVHHRLKAADCVDDLFSKEALKQIFLASQGIPREINNLATQVILKASTSNAETIDAKLVKQVLEQRELV
jgi:type II secretory pathway predicted ATPase ExeA